MFDICLIVLGATNISVLVSQILKLLAPRFKANCLLLIRSFEEEVTKGVSFNRTVIFLSGPKFSPKLIIHTILQT